MMLSALLVYMGEQPNATASLDLFGKMRTKNSKGVTIPSQKRYVGYAEKLMGEKADFRPLRMPPLYTLTKVVLVNAPDMAMDPKTSFKLELVHQQAAAPVELSKSSMSESETMPPQWQSWTVYEHGKSGGDSYAEPQASGNFVLEVPHGAPTLLAGDVKIVIETPKGKLTQLWFHTGFAKFEPKGGPDPSMVTVAFSKLELDKVCKDKKDKLVPRDFGVRLELKSLQEEEPAVVDRRRSVLIEELAVGVASLKMSDVLPAVEDDEGDEMTDDDDDDDDIMAVAVEPVGRVTPSGSGEGKMLMAQAVVVPARATALTPRK